MVKSGYKKESIISLIIHAQKEDNKALEELIRRVQKDVYSMFSYLTEKKEDITDLTQEALIKMARGLHALKDPYKFKAWLNHIVTNIFYDYVKKNKKNTIESLDTDKLLEIKDKIGCEPGEKCLFAEMEKLIKAALLNLPDTLRIVIILREFVGLSYEDISRITNTNTGTVKSRISRARLKLQNELKDFI